MKSIVQEILKEYPNAGYDSLIPILQHVQEKMGFLSEESVVEVSKYLKMPASKIFGVATFYNQFRFTQPGKYHVQVCRGTACHVLGSATVLDEIEKNLKIKSGQTTRDKLFSLEVVACIGACGLAPVISINGEFHAKVSSETIKTIFQDYKSREVQP
ncbi:MAG: NADH-quinone oxidoreductase subunit NuoE [Bacteroidales bacterium]|nr:NADH-quinone oxidoreductase subunit NuoE [Bacteroidales bacterium]MDP2237345.1 NADH-quinone oxidoreductase subunit NuoE [Bacteroidales bacterium]